MTRGRWIALLLLVALCAGGWYAHDAGYDAQGRAAYAEWAESRRLEAENREARGEKPTLFAIALDRFAVWVPGK